MQKFFVDSNDIEDSYIKLIDDNYNHVVNVLRMKKDEEILIGNKDTLDTYLTKIDEINNDFVKLLIIEKLDDNEPKVEIDLYQGLPKFDKMELIIQKTTEIGISKIIPVDMARCIVKLDEKDYKKKQERWQKIAQSAAEQSKRSKIPEICNKMKIKNIIDVINSYDLFLVAYEEEISNSLKNELDKLNKNGNYKIGILVGPEGGITKEEINTLEDVGAKIVTLGKRILRTETAPIVLTSNIVFELDN